MSERCSPFAQAWSAAAPEVETLQGMAVPARFGGPAWPSVTLTDCSFLQLSGVKGNGAAEWLRQQAVALPPSPNEWCEHRGGLVARLGHSEYLCESGPQDDWTAPLRSASALPSQTFPVMRQDASLLLAGERVLELFAQTCSFNVATLQGAQLAMTQMIGVSVLIVPQQPAAYRVWIDPSFASYFWQTLAQIAGELDGAPVGWRELERFGLARG